MLPKWLAPEAVLTMMLLICWVPLFYVHGADSFAWGIYGIFLGACIVELWLQRCKYMHRHKNDTKP